jgi:hypothetical protein
LRTNCNVGGAAVFIVAGGLLLASVSGKPACTTIAGRILKWHAGEFALIGWLLQTKALIMIIFANVLLDKQIITNETFTARLLMAVPAQSDGADRVADAGEDAGDRVRGEVEFSCAACPLRRRPRRSCRQSASRR